MGTGGLFLRKLRARVSEQPTGFVWVEKGKLAASGYPASRSQLEWLVAQGINSILTLTPEPLPQEWVEGLSLQVEHLPMVDHRVPEVGSLDRGASFVQSQVNGGKTVLVHCLAGEGRTGCVLVAYLVRDRAIGVAEALEILRDIKPRFVEWAQEKSLLEYQSSLLSGDLMRVSGPN